MRQAVTIHFRHLHISQKQFIANSIEARFFDHFQCDQTIFCDINFGPSTTKQERNQNLIVAGVFSEQNASLEANLLDRQFAIHGGRQGIQIVDDPRTRYVLDDDRRGEYGPKPRLCSNKLNIATQ